VVRTASQPDSDSYSDNVDDPRKILEVLWITRVNGETRSTGSRGNHKVQRSRTPCLTPVGDFTCIDPAISTRRLCVEGERIESGLRTLEVVLSAQIGH
jgi:hypothetical protein